VHFTRSNRQGHPAQDFVCGVSVFRDGTGMKVADAE